MAYTKILVVHNRLDKSVDYAQNEEKTSLETAIDYALNRDKTERTCFETAINCDRDTVYADMMDTKRRWGKEGRKRKGYHIIQSRIAIGSGQLWGKGFKEGTQSQLRFLPERHSDFAVAVFGEEWGFVGCVVLVTLFCLFLLSIFSTAVQAKDRFGSTLVVGVFFYFFWQILINMGMVIGLMPVVGIPLPFISYGGSATVVNFSLIGLVLNISMRRFLFKT